MDIESSTICRCCASHGPSKDLFSKYYWMGEEEVYSDMLKECFEIVLSENLTEQGICELCITQLRNAFNFRKQVLFTEERFQASLMVGKPFKFEMKLEEDPQFEPEVEFPNDPIFASEESTGQQDSDSDYEKPIKTERKSPKRTAKARATRAKKIKTAPESSKNTRLIDDVKQCSICGQILTTDYNLARHMLNAHGKHVKCTQKRQCADCGTMFNNTKSFNKHLAVGCLMKNRVCVECNESFDTKQEMLLHMRRLHWVLNKLRRLYCPLCELSFKEHVQEDAHLVKKHNVVLNFEKYEFDSEKAFSSWRKEIEIKTNRCFLRRYSSDGAIYYHCLSTKDLNKTRMTNDKTCPARLEILNRADKITVSYQSTHLCVASDEHESFTTKNRKTSITKLQCPLCDIHMPSFDDFDRHLLNEHGVDIINKIRDFNDMDGAATEAPVQKTRKKSKKHKGKQSATPERSEHRVNLSNILQLSNASPFRDKTANGFSCLYCAKYFKTIDELRAHTAQQSEKDKLNKMIDYKLSYNPIKVDITDLQCNMCGEPMKDLNDLKEHLSTQHNKLIHKDIKDIILPFRLLDGTNFTCVVCSMVHVSFKNLYQHMNSHYNNYCCDQCGAGYITIAALRKHNKTHEKGQFPCTYCDKTYPSLAKKRSHEKGVHISGWLRNKCPHCPEVFVSYYDRSEHLVKVHDEKPIKYPCNACSKVYKKKYDLNRHIRHHHLQLKSFICNTCNAKFFSRKGLIDHMVKHDGGESHTCDVCGKVFSRSRTLRDHLKGHEEGAVKYQCNTCGKTFTQKFSLKTHMRLHQDDMEIFKEFEDVKHLIDNRDLTLKQIAEENKRKQASESMQQHN